MDLLFISMPYARFISRWFANVPNINLGLLQSFLKEKGKSVKTFHFHLDFLPYLDGFPPRVRENLFTLTEQFGVEYLSLDYVFASLFFEEHYRRSVGSFRERLETVGLTVGDFEELRTIATSFVDSCFSRLLPYLNDAKLVGFSCSHYQLGGSLLLCARIKKADPDIVTLFGGKDCAGAFAEDLIRNVDIIDYVGTGECEITVDTLIDYLNGSSPDVCNVVYRGDDGIVVRAPSRPNYSIDALPFPEYDFDDFPIAQSEIILPIEFGRGCPWKRCTFCPDESYNLLCQAKTPGRITSEIASYQRISNELKNFFIIDSDALKNPKAIVEVSRSIQGRDVNFIYAEFRAEKMDCEVLEAIKRFGNWVNHFQIGIETFSEGMLRLMNKGVSVLKNVEVLKCAAEIGVGVQFNLFTCFPGMTEDHLKENLRVMDLIAHILIRDTISIFPGEFYLPPDCPIFLDAEAHGIVKSDRSIFSSIFADFRMPSYSNYPYPYRFRNDEEQYAFAMALRAKVDEIKNRNPEDTLMRYTILQNGTEIHIARGSHRSTLTLSGNDEKIYLAAMKNIGHVDAVASELGIPAESVATAIARFEEEGLVLVSPDRTRYLSLALDTPAERGGNLAP